MYGNPFFTHVMLLLVYYRPELGSKSLSRSKGNPVLFLS